jgi:hypothetical protein
MLEHGEFFKVVYLMCRLVSIGGLTILFLILGVWGRLAKPNKVRQREGVFLFPKI